MINMKKPTISFDKSSQKEVLELMGVTTDLEGYLVSEGHRVLAFDDGKEILFNEFGGMWKGKNGQMIYFKSDLPSLITMLDKINEEEKSKGIV
jgi:hypothetical protein